MGNQIVIKPIQTNDIINIIRIQTESELSGWRTDDYFEEIQREDSLAFTAKRNNRIKGFIISRLITTNHSISSQEINDLSVELKNAKVTEIEIYNLAVDKKCRKEGIGTLLLQKIAQTGAKHGTTSIWLEVRASNYTAIAFYEKNKFTEIYRRKNFYSQPQEDALVMKSDILNNLIQLNL